MSYIQDIKGLSQNDHVVVVCDKCESKHSMLFISACRSLKKNSGQHICKSCKAKSAVKPQNTKEYWTPEKRAKLGESISNSTKYHEAISNRDTAGDKNGMFGKKASIETKAKMSKSRIGKTGCHATAWKGGKNRLLVRVKGYCNKVFHWYKRIYERDGYKCVKCGKGGVLDAHHIDPISQVVKRLCAGIDFENDNIKFEWLIKQPEIIDKELINGITLCRACHSKEHIAWGSHTARVIMK